MKKSHNKWLQQTSPKIIQMQARLDREGGLLETVESTEIWPY